MKKWHVDYTDARILLHFIAAKPNSYRSASTEKKIFSSMFTKSPIAFSL